MDAIFLWCLVMSPLDLEVNGIEEALWLSITRGVSSSQNSSIDGHFHKDVTQTWPWTMRPPTLASCNNRKQGPEVKLLIKATQLIGSQDQLSSLLLLSETGPSSKQQSDRHPC